MEINFGWPGKFTMLVYLPTVHLFLKLSAEIIVRQQINGIGVPLCILGDPAYPLLSWLIPNLNS